MKLIWKVSSQDKRIVQNICHKYAQTEMYQKRLEQNVNGLHRPSLTKAKIWHTLLLCLLTTQQSSSKNSPVGNFLRSKPFHLHYDLCAGQANLEHMIAQTLTRFGGIRRQYMIAKAANENLEWLEDDDGWETLTGWLRDLQNDQTQKTERGTAAQIEKKLQGIGPKQSRNFLQILGLSKDEIPIDSRSMNWIKTTINEFPIPLNRTILSDEPSYAFVLDAVQELCWQSAVVPCLFDAAVFQCMDPKAQA